MLSFWPTLLAATLAAQSVSSAVPDTVETIALPPSGERGLDMIVVDAEAMPQEPELAKDLPPQMDESWSGAPVDLFVAYDEARRRDAFKIVTRTRRAGRAAQMELAGRSMKGQLKQANRIGADVVVLVGDDLEVKDMGSGEQVAAADVDDALKKVEELLAGREGAS